VSGYIIAGYLIVLGTLAAYAASLLGRQRAIRRRLSASHLHRLEAEDSGASGSRGELS
jgi:hypothetical protein